MEKIIAMPRKPSVFADLTGIEYFRFEEDFVEENIRCIPMIVRFKMDAAGIKLKLTEWCKFNVEERTGLAIKECNTPKQIKAYQDYLKKLVSEHTGNKATEMPVEEKPLWADAYSIPGVLEGRLKEENIGMNITAWSGLTDLQRFALLKLCRPGHESKNFIKAIKEFNIGE